MTIVRGELVAGRWRLGERLGRGAVADVHEGFDERTGEPVAVKALREVDPGQRARFEREVQVLETLRHPGIVGVRGHGELDGRPFLVLDRVDGGTLAEALATSGPLGPDRAAALGASLAGALGHAHRRGVVHRDVKPSNVLLDGDGRPHLADFGVALLDGCGTLTATGFTVGTAAYLAPEQVRGEPIGPPADVYALGLLVLEAATGRRAYDGAGVAVALARLDRPPEVPATLPPALAAELRAMTATDPTSRPSAASVAAALAAFGDAGDRTSVLPVASDVTEAIAVAGPAVWVAARPEPRWRPVAVAAACFAAGFLLVVAMRDLGGGGIEVDTGPEAPVTETTIPSTTTPPPPPTTVAPVPPPEDDGGPGGGNGRGNGNGRGDRDD